MYRRRMINEVLPYLFCLFHKHQATSIFTTSQFDFRQAILCLDIAKTVVQP